jgi:nucleotide-binding universal stress UspA family protein
MRDGVRRGILPITETAMYQKILFATDGSRFAEEALRDAIQLAKLGNGSIRVVSVVESPGFHGTPEAMALYETEMYRSLQGELERVARGAVERAAKAAQDAGLAASTSMREGVPSDEIVKDAKEWGADCIVMATHGRSGIGRFVLGSCAGRVVHDAPCPVLLHRAPKD